MSEIKIAGPVALGVAAALAGTFAVTNTARADTAVSPFAMTSLSAGYMLGDAEGNCGGAKEDEAEGKCGEGKCGEGKCGDANIGGHVHGDDVGAEGVCGGNKDGEGKCGEGKCGGDDIGGHYHDGGMDAEGSCGGDKG
jgi:uncharacterized low-complexity protein